jgi:hypothetical protein
VTKITASVPRSIVWAILAVLFAPVIVAIALPWWTTIPTVLVGSAVLVALAMRWGRELRPRVREAESEGGSAPYIEAQWPAWFKIADPKFGGLLMVTMLMLLCVLVIIAVAVGH